MQSNLNIEFTTQFKKDLKKAKKSGKNLAKLKTIMKKLEAQTSLPAKLRDHKLVGQWSNYRELHIESDWLLIYRIIPAEQVIIFVRLGSHSELFF